jgi:thymidylate kinase
MRQEDLFKIIRQKQKSHLKNTNLGKNSKLMIVFSGVPGSGKTYLSKILEKKYQAVRMRSDTIREIINKFPEEYFKQIEIDLEKVFNIKDKSKLKEYLYDDLSMKKETVIAKYVDNFLVNYSYKNTMLVYDGSIDRKYDRVKQISERIGFKLFLIKLPLNKKMIRQRIINRGEGDMTSFDTNLPRWEKDYTNLNKKTRADFEFNDNLEELIAKIDTAII